MSYVFTKQFSTPVFNGKISVNTGLFIDGQYVHAIDRKTIKVIDPTNESAITEVACAMEEDVDAAVKAADRAYRETWGLQVPGYERGRLLNRLADLLEQNIDEVSAIEAIDCGKMFLHVKTMDIANVLSIIRYFAGWADKVSGKTIETEESKFAYTRYEPVGVCGLITPWNFPIMVTASKIAPALAAGNTVVIKPSEVTPLSALKLGEFTAEAGFPPGVFNVIPGYGTVAGQALSENPLVRKISLTGSTSTGRIIMETASKTNLKRTTLELGGKSPNLIFDDADLEQAVRWSSLGIFHHSGQMCSAGSRIYVQEGIYDKFLAAFTVASQAGQPGSVFDAATSQGPVVSLVQYERVMGYIKAGTTAGARIHVGGTRIGTTGYYIQPTIFVDATADMSIVREEIFGPVAVIIRFKNEADAIEMANDSMYGLASNIFTADVSRALRVANALDAGCVNINMASIADSRVPFGGIKGSGFGKELGEYALGAYTNVKAVQINIGTNL
ncbi:hypothetical protein NM688_g2744 [Phlebia brevispora]|uniref:Uncharacterized protein n=1 Tax=Phlebia brevispora TaxID=194682 RepID=A0ACC1T7G8_9APHY|nr:hypothetical protein NM688_g2744 [Phlebia brevispora]